MIELNIGLESCLLGAIVWLGRLVWRMNTKQKSRNRRSDIPWWLEATLMVVCFVISIRVLQLTSPDVIERFIRAW